MTASQTNPGDETTAQIVLREDKDGVATLVLNRPKARNALSVGMLEALQAALDETGADDAVRVVVIAANGPAFCAGHDMRELRANPSRQAHETVFAKCSGVMQTITKLPKPVIARVQGTATAAGCQLVATCDLAVAADEARFATPGVNIGLFCTTPAVGISRNVPRKQMMEMLLTGDAMDARSALAYGLINKAVSADRLESETQTLAMRIASKSSLTIATGKQAFYRQLEMDLASAYDFASEVMTTNMLAHDAEEGIDAFLEKREPNWEDR